MMKNYLMIALLCSFAMPVVVAQAATVATPAVKEQKFEAHKAAALQKVTAKMAELQKKQDCINAATNGDALKACFPKREAKAKAK